MKKILFIRHAKSDWGKKNLTDFDRPLNQRGLRDAPEMGKRLHSMNLSVDRVFLSPATRTRQTIELLIDKARWITIPMETMDELYLPSSKDFMNCITQATNDLNSICICSHNPGITAIVNYLANTSIYNIPTCGLAWLSFQVDDWLEISGGTGQLDHYDFPKSTQL
ncbi:MAG: histidine phosphatase family protein [Vicingaceae bacterium]